MKVMSRIAAALLWILVILSFSANILLLRLLLDLRQQAADSLALAVETTRQLSDSTIKFTLHIKQDVPLSTTLPISTTVTTSLGAVVVRTDAPLSATLPLETDVPMEVRIGDTPFGASLDATEQYLERVREQWQRDPLQALLAPVR